MHIYQICLIIRPFFPVLGSPENTKITTSVNRTKTRKANLEEVVFYAVNLDFYLLVLFWEP
jgi:hypothetical protein